MLSSKSGRRAGKEASSREVHVLLLPSTVFSPFTSCPYR